MNELLKQFNEEMTKSLLAKMASPEVKAVIKAAQDADAGTFKVVISTDDVDRQGEVIKQEGLDFSNYLNNPIVLWAHDYASLPIGATTKIYKENGKTIAEGKFAPAEANPFAQQVRALYDGGFLKAVSVGVIPTQKKEKGVISTAEVLEYSFCPVPANPYALSIKNIIDWKLDLNVLATKGLTFKVESEQAAEEIVVEPVVEPTEEVTEKATPQEGDVCSLEDGSVGELSNVDGELVCIAKSKEKVELVDNAEPVAEENEGVADELAENEAQEAKWDRLNEFFELVDAFISAFLDESKTMADWDTLMAEFITLCQNVPMNEDDENPDGTRKSIVKAFGEVAAKAGRAISGSNAEVIAKCIDGITKAMDAHQDAHKEAMKSYKLNTTALSDMLEKATPAPDGDNNDEPKKPADKKRSISNGYPAKDFLNKDLLIRRATLREVNNAVRESLERINSKLRSNKK